MITVAADIGANSKAEPSGRAGNLILAPRDGERLTLRVLDGGELSVEAEEFGAPGDIEIHGADLVEIADGGSINARGERAIPSMPARIASTSSSPESPRLGRSIWVLSPVMTTREFKPRRVRNIFIWARVAFWASSRMTKASDRVRPRMYASGAISIVESSSARWTRSCGIMSSSAS